MNVKRIRRRNLIVAVMLSLFLINVIMTIDTRYSSDVYKSQRLEEREANPSVAVSYVDHAPIDVTQDADFEKEDWVGEGTVISPYILSGFRFNTTGIGISIRKTSAYFKISHCLFIGSTSTTGILLDSLQNAVLTGNSFQQIHYAMICVRTENILINESIISNCTIALSLEKASEFNITFSDFSSTNTAIYAKQADKLLIGSCMFKM
ncbi:MAG: hypothetical protein JW779_15015, partial [Candidatus Thorarchaeota archaeon]|nr:hypothetical protein [Candidatus Thorarchaeota archaeon]